MDAIERAIRNALERGDATERAFREKVYRSAQTALERGDGLSDEQRAGRRAKLKAAILQIESEFVPALAREREPEPELRAASRLSAPPPSARPAETRREPSFAPEPEPPLGASIDDDAIGTAPSPGDLRVERDERRVKRASRRRWPLRLALYLIVAVLLAGGGWWLYDTLLQGPAQPTAEAPTAEQPAPAAPLPVTQLVEEGEWIEIFAPNDLQLVSASGEAEAELRVGEGDPHLLVSSGASGTPVRFAVGQGVLEALAGNRVVIAIVASADESAGETQMSVDCAFADLGSCGRRRFLAGVSREEFLIDVNLAAGRPASGGTLSINSDIEGEGRPVRIYSIRVARVR